MSSAIVPHNAVLQAAERANFGSGLFLSDAESESIRKQQAEIRANSKQGPAVGAFGWRAQKGPNPDNKSGFRAVGHRILLSPDVIEEKTASGIVLPAKAVSKEKDLAVMATVIEIGHDCWTDKSTDYCQVGDRVLIGQYTGKFHESPVDGKTYRFVQDLDVISPIEQA